MQIQYEKKSECFKSDIFFYFNNHLPNKETNEKCLEKQRNQTKNRKTSPQQGNQRKLLRKTSPQQGNQRKALLDLAAARLVKTTISNVCSSAAHNICLY